MNNLEPKLAKKGSFGSRLLPMEEGLIIGREAEKLILQSITANTSTDLVAVYGRRRIGKTYLIRNSLQKQIIFEFSGIHNVDTGMNF